MQGAGSEDALLPKVKLQEAHFVSGFCCLLWCDGAELTCEAGLEVDLSVSSSRPRLELELVLRGLVELLSGVIGWEDRKARRCRMVITRDVGEKTSFTHLVFLASEPLEIAPGSLVHGIRIAQIGSGLVVLASGQLVDLDPPAIAKAVGQLEDGEHQLTLGGAPFFMPARSASASTAAEFEAANRR